MAEDIATSAESTEAIGFFSSLKLSERGDIFLALGVIGILTVMLFPVPTWLLDILLSISITFSVLILVNVLFISKSLEFSSFPTILLIAAIMRLALNIATTRTILSQGHNGPDSAGHVIEAFGTLVIGNNVLIGAIVFVILTLINFIVITKGSGRIAEVSARFSLDAMPGKQMAIDADLSAGLIDEGTAKARRKELEDESNFFGSMDGASKFVRGDAIAGIIITFINFVAGIVIGVVQRDMVFGDAVSTYTMLTIGDGLVSQIPSLVVSTSAGLLVTKAGVVGSADKAVFGQLGRFPQAMWMVSAMSLFMSAVPILPSFPFLTLAALTGGLAFYLNKANQIEAENMELQEQEAKEVTEETVEEPIDKTLQIDSVRLELGYGLLPLINYGKGQRLTEQIKALRKQMAKDLGFVMPAIRIQDNMQLPANTYIIKVKEIECGRGDLRPEQLLVMDPKGEPIEIAGEDTIEPTFGLPAKWVSESSREEALFKNYTVVPPPTVITTHLTEVVKENIADLLSYSETQKLLDGIGEEHKTLVDDTIPSQVSISNVQRVLQNLLAEHVSIRDLPTIIEALSEASKVTQSLTLITEHVRARLGRQISYSHANDNNEVTILALSPKWEQAFAESLAGGAGEEKQLAMAPTHLQEFIGETRSTYEKHAMQGDIPVLLTSPNIRPYVRAIVERFRPSTIVMSQNEIHPKIKLKNVGQL